MLCCTCVLIASKAAQNGENDIDPNTCHDQSLPCVAVWCTDTTSLRNAKCVQLLDPPNLFFKFRWIERMMVVMTSVENTENSSVMCAKAFAPLWRVQT